MSALTLIARRIHRRQRSLSAAELPKREASPRSEAIWFTVSFLLFLALGPFSAIAAVFGLISLIPGEETPEPVPGT